MRRDGTAQQIPNSLDPMGLERWAVVAPNMVGVRASVVVGSLQSLK